MKTLLLYILAFAVGVSPAFAGLRVESAILSASGESATVTVSNQVGGVHFTTSREVTAAGLEPAAQDALSALLEDLSGLLPADFQRGKVIVERSTTLLPVEWTTSVFGVPVVSAPEQPMAAVTVLGSHPTLGGAILSSEAGTLQVTRSQHAAILGLLDLIEADLAGDSE